MYIIGLTGGICSGKTTITDILLSYPLHIINADKLGHLTYLPSTECYNKLIEFFGQSIILNDGLINRKELGLIVFNDHIKMKQLNDLVWPKLKELIINEINILKENNIDNKMLIVIEAAIFIEAGWHDIVNKIWVVETER